MEREYELLKRLHQAEKRADEAERGRSKEKRRADEAEVQTRATNLEVYIAATHDLVFNHLTVETDKELTSRGSLTNPRNKSCPTNLYRWTDFLEQQRTILENLYNTFPVTDRRFESREFLAGHEQRISKRPILNEKMLEYFLHNSVEDPV